MGAGGSASAPRSQLAPAAHPPDHAIRREVQLRQPSGGWSAAAGNELGSAGAAPHAPAAEKQMCCRRPGPRGCAGSPPTPAPAPAPPVFPKPPPPRGLRAASASATATREPARPAAAAPRSGSSISRKRSIAASQCDPSYRRRPSGVWILESSKLASSSRRAPSVTVMSPATKPTSSCLSAPTSRSNGRLAPENRRRSRSAIPENGVISENVGSGGGGGGGGGQRAGAPRPLARGADGGCRSGFGRLRTTRRGLRGSSRD